MEYHELRGVMFECDVEIEHDPAKVAEYGMALFARYGPGATASTRRGARDGRQQAQKRVGCGLFPPGP